MSDYWFRVIEVRPDGSEKLRDMHSASRREYTECSLLVYVMTHDPFQYRGFPCWK